MGQPRERLLGQSPLLGNARHEDGRLFRDDERPVMVTLKYGIDVRDVVMGIERHDGSTRWLLVNSLPLPVGAIVGLNPQKARVVTTFADITKAKELLNYNPNTKIEEGIEKFVE